MKVSETCASSLETRFSPTLPALKLFVRTWAQARRWIIWSTQPWWRVEIRWIQYPYSLKAILRGGPKAYNPHSFPHFPLLSSLSLGINLSREETNYNNQFLSPNAPLIMANGCRWKIPGLVCGTRSVVKMHLYQLWTVSCIPTPSFTSGSLVPGHIYKHWGSGSV